MSDTTYTVRVPEHKAGWRLDKLLAEDVAGLSRSRLKALIEDGRVRRRKADGAEGPVTEPSLRVRPQETFTVVVPPVAPPRPEAQAIPLDVVYEDDDLIVLVKPAGLVVHPAAGNPDRTLVNALLAHCKGSLSGIGGEARPGIVHRLDKDTGGLMVAAKNDLAHRGLARQFAAHTLERAYRAVVWGGLDPRRGEVVGNIGRSRANRKKMAVLKSGGKPAVTRYQVLKPLGSRACLVECRLLTGRTHQIRVHLAERGHPVVGDPIYGGGGRRLKGLPEEAGQAIAELNFLALHAVLIGFEHPGSGDFLRFETPLPSQFRSLMNILDKL